MQFLRGDKEASHLEKGQPARRPILLQERSQTTAHSPNKARRKFRRENAERSNTLRRTQAISYRLRWPSRNTGQVLSLPFRLRNSLSQFLWQDFASCAFHSSIAGR